MSKDDENFPTRFQGEHLGAADALTVGSTTAVENSRAIAEVQAAVISAKRFPRDVNAAYERVIQACKRKSVAEGATYSYDRGGKDVSGPSIRMAEVLAQNYGNMTFGIVELERRDGHSEMMAYAHDLETNTRQTRIFQVGHSRDKGGGKVALKTDRDIYEMTANQGARRLRACILGIIPPDFIDGALEQCEKTMDKENKSVPLQDRARRMLVAYKDLGVTQEMIEGRLKHKIEALDENEFKSLSKIYTTIRDNIQPRSDFFNFSEPKPAESDIDSRLQKIVVPDDPFEAPAPKAQSPAAFEAPGVDPLTEGPLPVMEMAEPVADEDLADYVLTFGRHTGTKLKDLRKPELELLHLSLKRQQVSASKEMLPKIQEALMAIGDLLGKS